MAAVERTTVSTAATAGPHAVDDVLRAHGFSIVSREEGRSPLWVRNGKLYKEERAVRICAREDERAAARGGTG